jgi:hypothetical protein
MPILSDSIDPMSDAGMKNGALATSFNLPRFHGLDGEELKDTYQQNQDLLDLVVTNYDNCNFSRNIKFIGNPNLASSIWQILRFWQA